jgi:phosphoglycerate kinase
MKNVLTKDVAEKVALTGVVANYFLMLDGKDIGSINRRVVEEGKEGINDEDVLKLFREHREKIILPVDVGVEAGRKREDISLDELKEEKIMDIGVNTISMLTDEIPNYDVAVINGPAGIFEDERFTLGTFEVLKAVAKAGYSIVGGGHIATAARMIGVDKKMSHVSTGGGACIRFLSGEKLVALEVIRKYWEKKWSMIA